MQLFSVAGWKAGIVMTRQLYFNLDPDSVDAFGDISDVMRDTI